VYCIGVKKFYLINFYVLTHLRNQLFFSSTVIFAEPLVMSAILNCGSDRRFTINVELNK